MDSCFRRNDRQLGKVAHGVKIASGEYFMTENITMSADQIKKAVAAVKAARPAYAEILDFYEQLFTAREDAKSHACPARIKIPEDILSAKLNEKFPLISPAEFTIDIESSEKLLRKICNIAEKANPSLAVAAQSILKAADQGQIDMKRLFSGLFSEYDTSFETIAREIEIEKDILAFFVYNSIIPSVSRCAEQLSAYLESNQEWEKGYCPVCGSPPGLAVFQDQGSRFLFCSLCGYKWSARRIYCPFCDNTDSSTLHYFYSEEEAEYRADLCDNCNKYIKSADTRKMSRTFYPPLEQIATLHLDLQAKEKGYESGISFGV
jgi:FdhE protein